MTESVKGTALQPSTARRRRPLTPRHRQVLSMMAMGRTTREIADHLGLSPYTVGVYTDRIYLKLGVATRSEAIAAGLSRSEAQDLERSA